MGRRRYHFLAFRGAFANMAHGKARVKTAMVQTVKTEPHMSAEAFMAWYNAQPDGKRYELYNGQIYEMQGERVTHAETKARVSESFRAQVRAKGLPCQAWGDGMAVRVDSESVFIPDALVRCGPRLPGDTILLTDPVIVVELASPSTQRVDALWKYARYFNNPSIIHYVIVIPSAGTVTHHRRTMDGRVEGLSYRDGKIDFDPPGLTLNVAALFDDTA
jgi:Uma2 family endonuclease